MLLFCMAFLHSMKSFSSNFIWLWFFKAFPKFWWFNESKTYSLPEIILVTSGIFVYHRHYYILISKNLSSKWLQSTCLGINFYMLNLQLCILVAGALGGRFDHEIGNINVLYRFSGTRIILLSDDCLIYLLPKTHHHEIYIQSNVEGPHCGLIPVGAPSTSTTTTGLKWDLSKFITLKVNGFLYHRPSKLKLYFMVGEVWQGLNFFIFR